MASRLLIRRSTNLAPQRAASIPSNTVIVASRDVRSFHSYNRPQPGHRVVDVKALSNDSSFRWPDTRLGLLEPKDRRFPLPGLVGTSKLKKTNKPSDTPTQNNNNYEADVLTAELSHERQSTILEQFIAVGRQLDAADVNRKTSSTNNVKSIKRFDCSVHECPQVLAKDFYDMFPSVNIASLQSLTVITFCQKSDEVSINLQSADKLLIDGKVQLIESFIDAATDICELLHDTGYWADFVDPTSGRPHLGNHSTDAGRYETDERYRRLGFEIKSSGGCKVLQHHVWGSRPYVGCLFTNAPLVHPLLRDLARSEVLARKEAGVAE